MTTQYCVVQILDKEKMNLINFWQFADSKVYEMSQEKQIAEMIDG